MHAGFKKHEKYGRLTINKCTHACEVCVPRVACGSSGGSYDVLCMCDDLLAECGAIGQTSCRVSGLTRSVAANACRNLPFQQHVDTTRTEEASLVCTQDHMHKIYLPIKTTFAQRAAERPRALRNRLPLEPASLPPPQKQGETCSFFCFSHQARRTKRIPHLELKHVQ